MSKEHRKQPRRPRTYKSLFVTHRVWSLQAYGFLVLTLQTYLSLKKVKKQSKECCGEGPGKRETKDGVKTSSL